MAESKHANPKYPVAGQIKAVLDTPVPSLSGRWHEVPGFIYAGDRPAKADATFMQFFVSSFLRLYAVAVQHEFARAGKEIEFVALCKCRQDSGELCFHSYTPYESLVAFIRASIGSKAAFKKLPALLETFDGAIQPKCMFPNDVWVPVAVVYSPTRQNILFSNLNQIDAGDQFLNPGLCRTTSGFLNYLGSLMVKLSLNPKMRIQVANIECLLGKHLDPFIRWIHHAAATGAVFDSDRLYVNVDRPEEYDFKY